MEKSEVGESQWKRPKTSIIFCRWTMRSSNKSPQGQLSGSQLADAFSVLTSSCIFREATIHGFTKALKATFSKDVAYPNLSG
jgi:hypothetical protein